MGDQLKPLRGDDLEKQCSTAPMKQLEMETNIHTGSKMPHCKRIYWYALPVLCVWSCVVTFVAFPFIAVKLYERSTVVLMGRVDSVQDELVHIRHGNAVVADVLRELNQSHETQREMDVKMNERITELENDVNKKYESLNQTNAEMEKKLTQLDHKLDDEHSNLNEQLKEVKSKLHDMQQQNAEMEAKLIKLEQKRDEENAKLTQEITDVKSTSDDISQQATTQRQILDNLKDQTPSLTRDRQRATSLQSSTEVPLPVMMLMLACLMVTL